MKNIEPNIYRQRLIIEAHYSINVDGEMIRKYLLLLSGELGMHVYISEPIIHSATGHGKPIHDGYEGVIFWVESGAVIYVWEKFKFLTVEIYSCKPFDNEGALQFTKNFFKVIEAEYLVV